jgi:hypothetical protein
MQIINPLDSESKDIEPPLVKMAASNDRLVALKGRKLLELVRHLKAQGPTPGALGSLLLSELWLQSSRASVQVWVDWQDYGPMCDGLPVTHFRLQLKRENAIVSQEARTASLEEAEQFILQAFGWSS